MRGDYTSSVFGITLMIADSYCSGEMVYAVLSGGASLIRTGDLRIMIPRCQERYAF